MKRSILIVGLALLAASAPALAQGVMPLHAMSNLGPCEQNAQPVASGLGDPFGNFDGIANNTSFSASGLVELKGWALDDDAVAAVDILVDGEVRPWKDETSLTKTRISPRWWTN